MLLHSHRLPLARTALFACLLGVLAAFAPSAVAQPVPLTTDLITPPADSDDAAFAAWLEERVDAIGDVRKVSSSDLVRVFRELDSAVAAAEAWLPEHPESPQRADVLRILTRMYFLNRDRVVAIADYENEKNWGARLSAIERDAVIEEHRNRTLTRIQEGLSLAPAQGKTRAGLLETSGEVMLRAGRFLEGAEAFTGAIQADPTRPDLDESYIKLSEAFILAEDFPRAEAVALEALMRFPRSKLWPHYFWYYHKVLRHQGKIEEVLAAWDQLLPRMRAAAAGEPVVAAGGYVVPEQYRSDYQRYIDRADFYHGFFQYALGNAEEALASIRKFSDHHRARQMDGAELGMDLITYLDFQADPMDRRMSLLQGETLPSIEGQLDFLREPTETARRKPARVRIFCNSQRALSRQAGMFQLLRDLGHEYGDVIAVDWISFAMRDGDVLEREKAGMRQVIEQFGIGDWTIGVEVGVDHVHPSHGVEAANVVLFVTDTEGKLDWILIDPMSWDEGLIRRVFERLYGGE